MEKTLEKIGSVSKDTKLNLKKVLTPEGAPNLSEGQILGTALASAFATKCENVIEYILEAAGENLEAERREAAKTAASLMAMNNVYYRFLHLSKDPAFGKLPANLRMMGIANPGIEKAEFELYSLAVSAINGCGMCIESHVHEVRKGGISDLGIQSSIRIAAIINAAAQALSIEEALD